MTAPITIQLGHEELVYLLQLLRLPTLPGLPLNVVGNTDPETFQRLLGAAERSLQARGYIWLEANQLKLESALAGIIGFCASAPHTFSVLRQAVASTTPPQQRLYHLSRDLKLRHRVEDGIHKFTFLPNETAVLDDWLTILHPSAHAPSQWENFSLSSVVIVALTQSQQQPQLPDAELSAALVKLGYSPTEATAIVHFLRYEVISTTTIAAWQRPNDTRPRPEVALLNTTQGSYLLQPQPTAQATYRLEPISATELAQLISQMFSPFFSIPYHN